MNWSPQQSAFLEWCENGTGSCVLIAVAGAGKTTTAIEGVKRLKGGSAMMAFNKSSALDIESKLKKEGIDWKQCKAGTAHSFGFGAYRKTFPDVKVEDFKVANIVEDRIAAMVKEGRDARFLQTYGPVVIKLVSFAKQSALGVIGSINDRSLWMGLIEHYDVWGSAPDTDEPVEASDDALVSYSIDILERSNAMTKVVDYDDMIYLALKLRVRFWQYDNVLIDEAQDTNGARRALARVMLKRGGRLIAIGDPAQAINGFAGADNDALAKIAKDFNCAELPLTVSYRCPKKVVKYAQTWSKHIQAAPEAIEGEIGTMKADDILKGNTKVNAADAILCRNTMPLVTLAFKLIRARIGCRIEGREIGTGLIKLAHRWSRVNTFPALVDKLDDHLEKQRVKLLAKKQEARFAAVEDQVECLKTIIEACREAGKTSLSDIDAYINDLFGDNVAGVVTLSTIHKSKGREWQRVFWLNRLATCPSKWARQAWEQEQERNLQYVAATRSQHTLIDLTMPEKG